MPDNDLRWSEGLKLTPSEYFRLGALSVALPEAQRRLDLSNSHGIDLDGLSPSQQEEDILDEVMAEIGDTELVLDEWAAEDPEIAALLGEMTDTGDAFHQHLDDLSRVSAALDLSNGDLDLTGASYEPGAIHLAQEQRMARTRLARGLAREDYRLRGDLVALMEAYCETGLAGHPVEMASAPGRDADAIEFGQYTGDLARPCGPRDAFGRCASPSHSPSCSHTAEAAASYGVRPQDSDAWRAALARHSQIPAADADGRSFRTTDGRAATFSDHFEAQNGELARQPSRFEPGPDGRRDPSVIERRPDFPASTRDAAAAIIAQSMPFAAPRDAQWARLEARMDPRRQAAMANMQAHPDYRWPVLQAQREQAQARREPVQLSNYLTEDGEDLYGPLQGSLGVGIGGGLR